MKFIRRFNNNYRKYLSFKPEFPNLVLISGMEVRRKYKVSAKIMPGRPRKHRDLGCEYHHRAY